MFSYRQMICNRGTLNGRISRFGGKAGVLRSINQEVVQIVVLRRWPLVVGRWSFVLGQRPKTHGQRLYFASKSTVFTGRSQCASRISKRRCSSRR